VTDFESQKAMFKGAKEFSPSETVDVAIANAGISQVDVIYKAERKFPTSVLATRHLH
jgi:hypothetical protein